MPLVISAQAHLGGKVTDRESKEPILFGVVDLMQKGEIVKSVETDWEGNYLFVNISPGFYDVQSRYVGYTTNRITNYEVQEDRSNILNMKIYEEIGCGIYYTVHKIPLIDFENTSTGFTIISEDIRNMSITK